MSYRTNKNYTLIEELPDLEDLERKQNQTDGFNMIPPDNATQIQKFIRNNVYEPPIESGMSQRHPQLQQHPQQQHPQQQHPQQHPQQQEQFTMQYMEDIRPYELPQQIYRHNGEVNCINVSDHTSHCPVCSRLYQHNNSVYIVVIILLAIICILLLKRVLNV
jgi:hypothetical protein